MNSWKQKKKRKYQDEENSCSSIDDYLEETWFLEVMDEFKEDKEEIIESLKSYLDSEEKTYEQGMKYIFFCLKEIYE
jgi:hypothetical protein